MGRENGKIKTTDMIKILLFIYLLSFAISLALSGTPIMDNKGKIIVPDEDFEVDDEAERIFNKKFILRAAFIIFSIIPLLNTYTAYYFLKGYIRRFLKK